MKKLMISLIIGLIILGMAVSAYAHSGRTDAFGGHTVRTPGPGRIVGEYHIH